jgi:hypothetical protein
MREFLRILWLAVEAAALVLRWRYDPERLKRELERRIDDERERRQQTFRDALAKRDDDAVARMLSRARDRARDERMRRDAEGDVPPRDRPDGPPESR